MWKFYVLCFVVVLILGGCESTQTTNTAPTVVSVGTVYAKMTATAVAEATKEVLHQNLLASVATINASPKTPLKPGGRVVEIEEWGREFCDKSVTRLSCVTIKFKPSNSGTLYEITAPESSDYHRSAERNGFISASGPCENYLDTYFQTIR